MPVIVDTGKPGSIPDACALSIEIIPWAWESGQTEEAWLTLTINSGWVDANCLSLSTQGYNASWGAMEARLVVNGGLLTLHDEVPAYADESTPPQAGYGGRGLKIGGGDTSWAPLPGHVIINDGAVMTPKIAIYDGDIVLNGGLLYDTNSSPLEFLIRPDWLNNKIYIVGGKLGLKGDRVTELNTYIAARKIVPLRGTLVGPTYNAGATPEPNTTLTCDVNLAAAWQPTPENLLTDVRYHSTGGGVRLSWKAGDWIGDPCVNEPNNGHYVYFGSVFNDVSTSLTGTAGTAAAVYRGHIQDSQDDGNEPNFFIPESLLRQNANFYWRIDEANDACVPRQWRGVVWNFKAVNEQASNPSPANGATDLQMPLQLTWTAGDWTIIDPNEHRVYFGTDTALATTINNRGSVSTAVYPLSKLLEDKNGDSQPDWILKPNTTYYWQIWEKNSTTGGFTTSSKGPVWSFNTGDTVLVDDFQSYANNEDLNSVWLESLPVCFGSGGTGRVALIREGQSSKYMQFSYDKLPNGIDQLYYFSETGRLYNSINLSGGGVLLSPPKLLELMYRGLAVNSNDPVYDRMYLAVEDAGGDVNIVLNPDPDAQRVGAWTKWAVSYDDLGSGQAGQADLNQVDALYLGMGPRCNASALGGDGNVMFDDIKLRSSTCVPGPNTAPLADFDGNCVVDARDLFILASDWLAADQDYDWTATQQEPQAPILWYRFDEASGTDVADSGTGDANVYTGSVVNYNATLTWEPTGGHDGNGCIYLPSLALSYVLAPTSSTLNSLYFANENGGSYYTNQITISVWENADLTATNGTNFGNWARIFSIWNNLSPSAAMVQAFCPTQWWNGGSSVASMAMLVEAGYTYVDQTSWGDAAGVGTGRRAVGDFGGRWNNWIFIKSGADVNGQHLLIYLNGVQVADTNSTTDADILGPLFHGPVGEFRIGTGGGNWAMWAGRLDDFKVWKYGLNENEIHYVATDGTGILHVPVASVANIKHSTPEVVNLGDLEKMCSEWLTTKLWP
jgi:hypothetical protein